MSIPCPQNLGKFSSFHRIFVDFENKDEIVAYACLLYTVSKIIKNGNITPDLKSYISIALDRLESWKKDFSHTSYNEIIGDESILSSHISNVANKIFSWAETNDLEQKYNTEVIQSYYMSSILFVVSQHFLGENPDKDDEIKRKFATQRSLHLKKCLKSNLTISTYDCFCKAFNESLGLGQSKITDTNTTINQEYNNNKLQFQEMSYSTSLPSGQSLLLEPSPPISTAIIDLNNVNLSDNFCELPPPHPANNNSYYNTERPTNTIKIGNISAPNNFCDRSNWDTTVVDYEISQQAQKLLKHAGSALSYDDVDTAIDLLNNVLNILTPYSKRHQQLL